MGNKVMALFLMLIAGGMVSAWEIEDVNGTYVYDEEHLDSDRIHPWNYSWGQGLSITETSIEFDLGERELMMPGLGLYIIDTVIKDTDGSISLKVFSVGDEDKQYPIQINVRFLDYNRVYITCDRWRRWSDRTYSPEEKWIWYRLSGPAGK